MKEYTLEHSAKVVLDTNEKIRVLHVDDDSSSVRVAKQCLEMQGHFQVDVAFSVDEALAKLENEKYDVVVSEYQMLGKDGSDFLKELRKNGNRIPFIVFTGKGREEIVIKALNLGADYYLNKGRGTETVYTELAQSITELAKVRKAEENTQKAISLLCATFESTADGLLVVDGQGKIAAFNRKFIEMWHIPESVMAMKDDNRALNFVLDQLKNPERFLKKVRELYSQLEAESFDTLEFKDGRVFERYSRPQRVDGVVVGRVWSFRDVTEGKKSEDTIRESGEKFRGLFMGNPEATVYLSPDFRILDINPRFEKLFGYSPAEVRGKHVDDVIVQRDKAGEADSLNKKAVQGYVYHDTVRKRKDGSLIPVSVSAAPITVDGKVAAIACIYKDISELKDTEKTLKDTMDKLATMNEKLRVVGSLTRHDARNKLTVVTGNVYLLKKKTAADPEMLERLKDMEEACNQIVRIFDFTRNYETLGEEALRYVDVADAFDKSVVQFSGLKGVKTVNECKGLTVVADSLLTRMFYNLIENSLKYGEKLTQIRIRHEDGEEQLKLVYEDDGVGIPETEKPKLFRQGYGKGTGYGLYLIKKMMEAYGWTIQETGRPGNGAQFTITIPRTNQNAKENYRIAQP